MRASETVRSIEQSTHHYLVIRPFSTDPHKIDPYLAPLSELTGLDKATIRQKFTGEALQVLLSGQDADILEHLSGSLKAEGFPCCVISKRELQKGARSIRAADLEAGLERLRFMAPGGGEITSLDRTQETILVLTTMKPGELKKKQIARLVVGKDVEYPLSRRLRFIFQNHPVMDIYISGSNTPLRLDSQRFNFHSLGEGSLKSITQNFPEVIKLIRKFSVRAVMDAGFGESELPFLNSPDSDSPERLLNEFALYSRFVYLAYTQDMFRTVHDRDPVSPVQALGELDGLLLTGPLLGRQEVKEDPWEDPGRASGPSGKASRIPPSPPESPIEVVTGEIRTWGSGLKLFLRQYRRHVRRLGPPVLIYPLTAGFFCSIAWCYAVKQFHFLSAGLIFLGLIGFIHSFIMIKRKRALENCPTSKIRSMPMGLVEVKGKARQKYFLKTPYSQTDCVYYSYKKYRIIYNGLVVVRNNVDKSWSNINVLLKQRHDELPKLVSVCERYMKHEADTLERVTRARAMMSNANTMEEKRKADGMITEALKSLFAVSEKYPELKADKSFGQIQARITELEEEIADRRELYNEGVNIYNIRIERVPDVFVAKLFDYQPKVLWQINREDGNDVRISFSY